jgi:hypothetical protein
MSVLILPILAGCTVAGAIIDGQAISSARNEVQLNAAKARSESYQDPFKLLPKDKNGFSFAGMGFYIDSAIVAFVKSEITVEETCKQITKTVKECKEVDLSTPNIDSATQTKTDYEIISVVQ